MAVKGAFHAPYGNFVLVVALRGCFLQMCRAVLPVVL